MMSSTSRSSSQATQRRAEGANSMSQAIKRGQGKVSSVQEWIEPLRDAEEYQLKNENIPFRLMEELDKLSDVFKDIETIYESDIKLWETSMADAEEEHAMQIERLQTRNQTLKEAVSVYKAEAQDHNAKLVEKDAAADELTTRLHAMDIWRSVHMARLQNKNSSLLKPSELDDSDAWQGGSQWEEQALLDDESGRPDSTVPGNPSTDEPLKTEESSISSPSSATGLEELTTLDKEFARLPPSDWDAVGLNFPKPKKLREGYINSFCESISEGSRVYWGCAFGVLLLSVGVAMCGRVGHEREIQSAILAVGVDFDGRIKTVQICGLEDHRPHLS